MDTQEKIINAALELFVLNGYHGTSISDIVQKVGLTKGALYAHFTSKSDLLFRIVRKFKEELLDELIRTVNEFEGDSIAKLHRAISFNSDFAMRNLKLVIFLTFISHELSNDSDFEFALKGLYREYQKFVSSLIQKGITQGLLKEDLDPDMAAMTFMAIHDGVLHHWVLNRYRMDGTKYVKTFRRIFFEGIKR